MTSNLRIRTIEDRLKTALSPSFLEVIDESSQHVGHVGSQNGAGHYLVRITSPLFATKKLLETHRMIYAALGEMMQHEIHALRIQIV